MINSNVLYQKEDKDYSSDCTTQGISNIGIIVGKLYQVDVYQPLIQVQQQILDIIATEVSIKAMLWHAKMEKDELNTKELLQQNLLTNKVVRSFDVKLDDSNIHHYFFVIFPTRLSDAAIENHSQYLTALLHLIAEIYRQTLIHSYYQEWKSLPFKQIHQPVEGSIYTLKAPPATTASDNTLYETWHEKVESKQETLIRAKRIEDQVFIDKFILPKSLQSLTFKQKQICFFLKACCSNQQIAENLNISVKTVGNHLTTIYEKLQVSRAELFQLLNASD